MPLASRRRRAPRRPAGLRDGAGVRRHPALARRDGGDHRAGGVRRRDGLPRAVGGPDPAHPAPGLLDPGQAAAPRHDARPAARAGAAAARRPRARRTRSSCCGPTPTCATAATTRSRAAASAAWRAATARRCDRAQDLVYLEDQYVWGHQIGEVFTETLRRHPDLHVVAVVPLFTDQDGFMARVPQQLGRARAMREMLEAAPGRVAVYGVENHEGTPVYVHAKVCVVDDTWASIGSDNFNRRSLDPRLRALVRRGRRLRRGPQPLRAPAAADPRRRAPRPVRSTTTRCSRSWPTASTDPACSRRTPRAPRRLDAWHDGGRVGERPPGRLRRLEPPELNRLERLRRPGALPHPPRPRRAAEAAEEVRAATDLADGVGADALAVAAVRPSCTSDDDDRGWCRRSRPPAGGVCAAAHGTSGLVSWSSRSSVDPVSRRGAGTGRSTSHLGMPAPAGTRSLWRNALSNVRL